MAQINKKIILLRLRLFKSLLKILGIAGFSFLASCYDDSDIVPMYGVPMYGAPVDESISIYGTIKSGDSLQSIPGLDVQLVSNNGWDSLQTTSSGTGQFSFSVYAFEDDEYTLRISDVDSTDNGSFENKEIDVIISGRDENNHEKKIDISLDRL